LCSLTGIFLRGKEEKRLKPKPYTLYQQKMTIFTVVGEGCTTWTKK